LSTQDNELRLVPGYCLLMYGNARLTMKRSRLDMNTARDSTPTTAVTRACGAAAVAGRVEASAGGVELTSPPRSKSEIWTYLNSPP
jgi:hypothetical protein